MSPRPIIAVVPFGARGTTSRAGAWARQIARRLVERRPPDDALELRPVFMVAMAAGVWFIVPEHAGKELNAIAV